MMTEAEWLACEDPTSMLESLGDNASDRKLRLFAVSCCRELWDQIGTAPTRHAVEIAERYADGQATAAELDAANEQTPDMDPRIVDDSDFTPVEKAACCVADVSAFRAAQLVLGHCSRADFDVPFRIRRWRRQKAQMSAFQVKAIRDIFGYPFRPVAFAPEWRTDTATAIARQMYESREFSAMPILADALQDAGCDNADILNHCRDATFHAGEPQMGSPYAPSRHVRGCWVVDLVLGKE